MRSMDSLVQQPEAILGGPSPPYFESLHMAWLDEVLS